MEAEDLSQVLVIMPTYNERENLVHILPQIFQKYPTLHVLIVDDNSPDGTRAVVYELQKDFPRLYCLEREKKDGLGQAYLAGFAWGIKSEKKFQYFFEMDADFSHPVEAIQALYQACVENADVCIGSRYIKGGNVKGWDKKRLVLSKMAALYVQLVLGMPVKDPTAGFICYRRRVLENLPLKSIKFSGYIFQIAMKYFAWKKGFAIYEKPITFVDRLFGTSKMNMSIFKEALLGVIKLRKMAHLLILAGLVFSAGCNESQTNYTINEEKMADILYEIIQLEAYASTHFLVDTSAYNDFQARRQMVRQYERIFANHQINPETFLSDYKAYSAEPDEIQYIYQLMYHKYFPIATTSTDQATTQVQTKS